jgi:hypothetical protein
MASVIRESVAGAREYLARTNVDYRLTRHAAAARYAARVDRVLSEPLRGVQIPFSFPIGPVVRANRGLGR